VIEPVEAERTILITGATGLVGSLLTLTALRAGHSVRLLVRGHEGPSVRVRLRQILGVFGCSPGEWEELSRGIELYEGDIALPLFGLPERQWGGMAEGLSWIYHTAAHTGFRKDQRVESFRVNVEGSRHVLALAEASRAHLFHISTAYLGSETDQRVLEQEVEGPRQWRNPYEETKYIAEREIHRGCRDKGLTYTVFRPGILCGDVIKGRTIRFNTIYYFMKLFHHGTARQGNGSPLILEAKPEATLNMVPIDYAVKAIWTISHLPACKGKIFHITNPSPPRFQDLIAMGKKLFGRPIEVSDHLSLSSKRAGDKKGNGKKESGLYAPYMFGEPEFDRRNTRALLPDYDSAFPSLDENYFRRILVFAVEQKWKPPFSFQASVRGERKPRRIVEKYFSEFLGGKLNQHLLKSMRNLSGVFSIQIEDGRSSTWLLEVREGELLSVSKNGRIAEWSYTMDVATFEKVVRGLYPPEEAFFDGRIDIKGDMEKGLYGAAALSDFCRTFPYKETMTSE
jgi:nucleoside-diphosphate-sugar epimerase/predicted lipid carrier protein YhbT